MQQGFSGSHSGSSNQNRLIRNQQVIGSIPIVGSNLNARNK